MLMSQKQLYGVAALQVAEMMHENKALRSSLVSPGAWDGSRTAPHSPVFVPSHTGDFQSYRALVSPRSRARSPGNTAYGSTSVPMRAQEVILDTSSICQSGFFR